VPSTEVFAVHGAEPEVQAYAMAKYSRSALSMKQSLREINEEKAEKFLNTFYFQYGHRSIADLAHIALAVERLSILAAIAVVDEQRWDGQERSTRYQDFKKSGYFLPELSASPGAEALFRGAVERLMDEYAALSRAMLDHLKALVSRPPEMTPEAYERTLRARAFDISRYLLPLATNTSLGQIVNARTLETQVARLLASPYSEVRRIGEHLKQAAREPAYNVNHEALEELVRTIRERDPELGERASHQLLKQVRVAPTLVKYAEPNVYEMRTRAELRQAAAELMQDAAIEPSPSVELLPDEPLEVELPAILLYEHSHYPYRQIRERVEALNASRRQEIIDAGCRHRGRHDELLRAFCAGQRFRFDILMDLGGFRDLHRHRRCIQIAQEFTFAHGYETPDEVPAAGLTANYDAAMHAAQQAGAELRTRLRAAGDTEAEEKSCYLLPLGYRKRALFKMDLAQVVYMAELRTAPAGHISYRRVAHAMYEETLRRYPGLRSCFARVTNVAEPVDLLQR
jgi:thymidylate synthase ThyX